MALSLVLRCTSLHRSSEALLWSLLTPQCYFAHEAVYPQVSHECFQGGQASPLSLCGCPCMEMTVPGTVSVYLHQHVFLCPFFQMMGEEKNVGQSWMCHHRVSFHSLFQPLHLHLYLCLMSLHHPHLWHPVSASSPCSLSCCLQSLHLCTLMR